MFGFIIIRHVSSPIQGMYWIECVNCIRKFYNNPIVIIDDNSNPEFILDNEFENVTVIKSEFPKRGELLPYYYLYKKQLFDKAVMLHDSVFIQKRIDFESVTDVKFLWTFEHWNTPLHKVHDCKMIIAELKNTQNVLQIAEDGARWLGCFGVMSCITFEFLENLVRKYDIFRLTDFVKDREHRMLLERIFGIICCYETAHQNSMFGDIKQYMKWGYTYNEYIENGENYRDNLPIIKIWSGR